MSRAAAAQSPRSPAPRPHAARSPGRTHQPRLLELQQLAGNQAVTQLISVQRADKPANLDEAIRTGDSSALDPFRPFTGISANQLLSLVNLIVTQTFVSWREESILEEAWRSRGNAADLSRFDFDLWKSCQKRGADPHKVQWMRDLRTQFATDVREEARENLRKNGEIIDAESRRLGISSGADPAAADEAVREQVRQASLIRKAKETLRTLGQIDVGYTEPPIKQGSDRSEHGGTSPAGGTGTAAARNRAGFNPLHAPPYPAEKGDGMASWETIIDQHQKLNTAIGTILNENPALYAMMVLDAKDRARDGGSDALASGDQSPAGARAKMGAALAKVTENIRTARRDIDDKRLRFESMSSVQDKLFEKDKTWSRPFAQGLARDYVKESGEDAAKGAMLVEIALLAAVTIGTAGTAAPLLGAIIGLTSSSAAAADSWNQAFAVRSAGKATVKDELAIVGTAQAAEAEFQAMMDTITALVDVYGAAKAVRSATSLAKVAGLEAKLAAKTKLANFATLPPAGQKQLLTEVVEAEGAQAAVLGTGRKAEDLIPIVGRDTTAGQRLLALAGGAGHISVKDLEVALPLLAQKSAAEAGKLVQQSIDLIGPADTLRRVGGWGMLEQAVGKEAGAMARLEAWRSGLIDQAGQTLGAASGKEGVSAARSLLAKLGGMPEGAVETGLGILLTVMENTGAETPATSAVGSYGQSPIDLDEAATRLAAKKGVAQRQMIIGPNSPPLPLTEHQLNRLSHEEFEEVIRRAIAYGHFAGDGLPRMSVLELKNHGGGHGLDGIGLRRRENLVDLYKFEFKQVTSDIAPSLDMRAAGVQGGYGWTVANIDKLMASSDPVAFETLDVLERRLKRYFGTAYKESLMMEALRESLGRAPLVVVTRVGASLETLVPQLRGLARSLGRGNVKLLLVRGRPTR
ncbi:uncharacterized protein YidB (DUF937 family) [Allocatelliglobosispora scoriae]|uniref:Uncharacterized protein YidB (DUF937 family) n=1 Tax=Allocatelliglobosispora scoriae TaxID=643052 RepID=A0A841BJV6_9ACTN|nr:hypothetical protein [Allocatelliglobosispora scoriae]MBB5867925.1 uncharacterized protein YidB (DUF937 family) [Allocatelliglobosispora scoriae]